MCSPPHLWWYVALSFPNLSKTIYSLCKQMFTPLKITLNCNNVLALFLKVFILSRTKNWSWSSQRQKHGNGQTLFPFSRPGPVCLVSRQSHFPNNPTLPSLKKSPTPLHRTAFSCISISNSPPAPALHPSYNTTTFLRIAFLTPIISRDLSLELSLSCSLL